MAESCLPLLVQVLRAPATAAVLEAPDWDRLIRQARHANLLGRLAHRVADVCDMAALPPPVQRHLDSARNFAAAHARVVHWEVNRIRRALAPLEVPVILLKGAAYLLSGSPVAVGRVFSDVDILVPRARLDAVEESLYWAGWLTTHHDAYDQRYYRQWMHELPPLRHVRRKTVLDVHHNILPETARLHPDPEKLIAAAECIDAPDLHVLSTEDRILHSATHLFHDGEFEHGLRDLVDLDGLIREAAGAEARFWERLPARADELQLSRPLAYALRYCREILGTPVPEAMRQWTDRALPGRVTRGLMDALMARALRPPHPSCEDAFTAPARWLLYVRGHALRMPPHLLLPHLLRKAVRSEE
ncbi:nucleotidyltransferase domain-containing protein [Thiohalobacter thiocyanaticus]|uniref:Nucleotidyltransferase family protein n=1 Tax=Thiohalobacter thiocyanaticus TaxID=585455 RepID=A0A426QMA2_9GAMM|nr:nucleotidyltransferase family protein [Thiohalobacter thiocyanaticus]RRQ22857.1 hypothetical protein D6C00_13565 [Thiohalobacter thiocyanaticus]